MAEIRIREERLEMLGRDLIANDPALAYIRNSGVEIAFLASDSKKMSKGKMVLGECEKVPAKYRWRIHEDFTVTVFEQNTEHFTEEQYKMLLLHELLHIGIEKGANGELDRYYIRPHDLEDFKLIIDRYGTEWAGLAPNEQLS